jgi:hypothetical protein
MTDFDVSQNASDTVASADVSGGIPLGRHPQGAKLRFHLVEQDDDACFAADFISGFDERARWANRVVYTRQRLCMSASAGKPEARSDPHQNDAERGSWTISRHCCWVSPVDAGHIGLACKVSQRVTRL